MKRFKLHWGSGVVAEEARAVSDFKNPTIQLLKFDSGLADGKRQIRFCQYSPKGAFLRSPLIIDESDIPKLKKELDQCPELRKMISKLL